jgi:recombination protein RecA
VTRATKRETATPEAPKKAKKEKAPDPNSLEGIRLRIRNRYERPTVVYETDTIKVPIYPTRFPELNAMCGGGIPGGSVIEIYGPEDSCKTSFALALAADIQAAAPPEKDHVVFNNYERRQPWRWWQKLGLKTDEKHLTHMLPVSLEEGIGDSLALVETGRVCAVLIDSVFAAGSREGKEAVLAWSDPKAKKASLGVEARKWGEAWTAVVPVLQSTDTVAIAINQIRDMIDVGAMARPRPGMEKPTTTPRGRALKFYAWMRLETRARNLDPNEYPDVDGRHVKVKCIKNGFSEGARARFELDMIRGEGFDVTGSLVKVALEAGLIETSGSWYSVQGKRIANGKVRLRERIVEHPPLRAWLEGEVSKFLTGRGEEAGDAETEENGGAETPIPTETSDD